MPTLARRTSGGSSAGRGGAPGAGRPGAVLAAVLAAVPGLLPLAPALADTWVFEPSISLDQRFDDNYRLETALQRNVSATRLVGDLGVSRESRTVSTNGGIRVDGLLTQGEYEGDELDSNYVLFSDSSVRGALTTFTVRASLKEDTPSRDISADLSDAASEATDNGVVTQRSNVARSRLALEQILRRELTRRASVEAMLSYTDVAHELPDPADATYSVYIDRYNAQNADGFAGDDIVPEAEDGSPLPIGEVSTATPGIGPFTPDGELDDYREVKLSLGYRYSLSPISSVSTTVAFSRYEADLEAADVLFDDLVRDGTFEIFRRPRGRLGLSTTASFRLGYARALTPTLRGSVEGGVYTNTSDETDTYRPEDRPDLPFDPERLASLESEQDGWLAKVSLSRDAGLTRYTGSFGVDVQPSSIGTQVEAQELIGDVYRTLTPLLDFSFRVRAYEPDRLGANPDDRFARRFLSIEPKLVWRFDRAWTLAASYRYRRQKSRVETESGESNALLFSLTYTPPSAIRDAVNADTAGR